MKKTLLMAALFTFGVVATTVSLAQSVAGSGSRGIRVASHVQHASLQPMAPERDLHARTTSTLGKGERPLSEFGQLKEGVPLGEIARQLRQEHATAKKAVKVLEQ